MPPRHREPRGTRPLPGGLARVLITGMIAALGLAAASRVGATEPGVAPIAAPVSAPISAPISAPADSDPHAQGRRIYNERCYFCHGYAGDARTLAATYLDPPPLDFGSARARQLDEARLVASVSQGVPGTAMQGFSGLLSPAEIGAVSRFVLERLIRQRHPNTSYHTVENGWPEHERHRDAFPFARGEIALDTPWEQLGPAERRGRQLFMSSCISCHDHARVQSPGPVWDSRPLTTPRDAYCTSCHANPLGGTPDASRADALGAPYRLHDRPPATSGLTRQQRRGERLYQRNCAYCHAADGSARSWIGQFLQPHPRNLTDPAVMAGMRRSQLRQTILDGLPGTSMPAWRGVLGRAEIDAVISYIDRVFHPLRAD